MEMLLCLFYASGVVAAYMRGIQQAWRAAREHMRKVTKYHMSAKKCVRKATNNQIDLRGEERFVSSTRQRATRTCFYAAPFCHVMFQRALQMPRCYARTRHAAAQSGRPVKRQERCGMPTASPPQCARCTQRARATRACCHVKMRAMLSLARKRL